MYQDQNGNVKFNFRDSIKIAHIGDQYDRCTHGIIQGKIKDIDAYVISANTGDYGKYNPITMRFGHPNRHLELEWGRFYGGSREFIVPVDVLEVGDR